MQFLGLQSTYNSLELGLFDQATAVSVVRYDDLRASSNLIPFLDTFLKKHAVALADLSFIAVDKGPGAFTSLRAAIASINGLSYASKIPLVAVNSLEALQSEADDKISVELKPEVTYLACLLNAYNNDVYFRIFDKTAGCLVDESCQKIDALLEKLCSLKGKIACIGNGVVLHKQQLENSLAGRFIDFGSVGVPSVLSISKLALKYWQEKSSAHVVSSVEPYYLKTQLFAIKN